MDRRDPARTLRWFFLIWEGLVYLWGMLYLCVDPQALVQAYDGQLCAYGGPQKSQCIFFLFQLNVDAKAVVAFSMLMLLHVVTLWLGLSGRIPSRFYPLYFLTQGGVIFGISLIVPRATNVALSLYLVLALSAIGMLTRIRSFAAVACLSIVLFVLCSLWNWTAWANWQTFWIRFWFKSDYPVLVLFAVGYLFLYVQQMRAQAQLRASAERIEELTRLTERRRLARELHDTLAQGLAGVMMQLQAANARLTNGRHERAQEAVQQAITDVRAALAEARFAIDDLRAAEVSAPPLPEAVSQTIERFATATGIPCDTDLAALSSLAGSVSDHVHMAIREGLSNVARHAQARHVWVSAVQHGTDILVEVRDDGIGFDVETIALQPGHYGLVGLRERARLAEGRLEIVTAPGAGTTIRLVVPCRNAGDSPMRKHLIAAQRETAP